MTFLSREEAGVSLGRFLAAQNVLADLVLGLPRGGVVVAAGVAQILKRPLDVIVVRKVGHPFFREFAVGALAEENVVLLDESAIRRTGVNRRDLDDVIAEEQARLAEYQLKFRKGSPARLTDQHALIVDDGLATGATTEAAVLSAKKRQASKVTVAIPVASEDGFRRLRRAADDVIALLVDPAFEAVGQYYERFPQTTDEEVLALLAGESEGSHPGF